MAGIVEALRTYGQNVMDNPQSQMLKSIATEIPKGAWGATKNVWGEMHPMDKAALATAPIPIVGDVMGAAADARMYAQEPESRTWGNAALTGLGLLPFIPSAGMVKAYHGTPHKVDRFSMDKIGTGEGAQAYGHGLYFAENPDVAGQYADMSKRHAVQPDSAHIAAAKDSVNAGVDPEQVLKSAYPDISKAEIDAAIIEANGGYGANIYNVNLDVNHEDLLDWDAPLSEEKYQKIYEHLDRNVSPAYAQAIDDGITLGRTDGQDFMEIMQREFGEKEASEILKEAGIPGIRYLDGNSRSAKEGTRNFVIFDEDLIEIDDGKKILKDYDEAIK